MNPEHKPGYKLPWFIKLLFVVSLLCALIAINAKTELWMIQAAPGDYYEDLNGTELIEDGSVLKTTVPTYLFYESDPSVTLATSAGGTIYRGWVVWDISDLSDITIQDIALHYHATSAARNVTITELSINPVDYDTALGRPILYNQIASGLVYLDGNVTQFPTFGTGQSITLPSTASADLQTAIDASQGWFAIGFMATNEQTADGSATYLRSKDAITPVATPQLTLHVTYDHNHNYTFPGLFYENGTKCANPVYLNITTIFPTESTEEFNVTGTIETYQDFLEQPTRMSWDFGTITRYYYILDDTETIYPFQPDGNYAVYDFSFHDYAGLIGTQDTYLEALRYVNGTQRIVERVQVFNSETDTSLSLIQYQLYAIRLRLADDSYYNLGDFIAGDEDPAIYNLIGINWEDQYQAISDYITIKATRPNSTHIRFTYNSSLEAYSTIDVNVSITYRNGTVIFSNYTAGSEDVAFNWFNPVNTTAYRVNATIYHGYYGLIEYSTILDGAWFPANPFNFDAIGLPLEFMCAFLVLAVLGTVSRYGASIGVFCATIVGVMFNGLNWWDMPETIQAAGIIMAVLIRLSGRDS